MQITGSYRTALYEDKLSIDGQIREAKRNKLEEEAVLAQAKSVKQNDNIQAVKNEDVVITLSQQALNGKFVPSDILDLSTQKKSL